MAGLPERAGAHCFNSAVVVGPKGFIGCYRKTHLFFEETIFFTPGDTGFHVWDIGVAKVGVMICFDWFYPEAARTLALQGADIIAHPSNLVLPHCPGLDGDALPGKPGLQRDGESDRQRSPRRKGPADLYRDERSRQSPRPHCASRSS